MKKNILLLLLLFGFTTTYSQDQKDKYLYRSLAIDIGPDFTFAHVHGLNHWAVMSGQSAPKQSVSAHLRISYFYKHYGGGIEGIFPYPYEVSDIFIGRKLTRFNSPVTSLLNLHFGNFAAIYKHLRPDNYTLTADQQGKSLQLQFNKSFFGLSSKNYWSYIKKKGGSTIVGLEILAGYMPWSDNWQFGYYVHKPKTFISNRVYGIPSFGKLFFNAGLLIGLASR